MTYSVILVHYKILSSNNRNQIFQGHYEMISVKINDYLV